MESYANQCSGSLAICLIPLSQCGGVAQILRHCVKRLCKSTHVPSLLVIAWDFFASCIMLQIFIEACNRYTNPILFEALRVPGRPPHQTFRFRNIQHSRLKIDIWWSIKRIGFFFIERIYISVIWQFAMALHLLSPWIKPILPQSDRRNISCQTAIHNRWHNTGYKEGYLLCIYQIWNTKFDNILVDWRKVMLGGQVLMSWTMNEYPFCTMMQTLPIRAPTFAVLWPYYHESWGHKFLYWESWDSPHDSAVRVFKTDLINLRLLTGSLQTDYANMKLYFMQGHRSLCLGSCDNSLNTLLNRFYMNKELHLTY